MSRRAVVIFKKYGDKELNQNQLVSMIYQLLTEGNPEVAKQLHTPQKFKPFTYALEENDGYLTLYYSSIYKDITDAFLNGAKKSQDKGLVIADIVFKVVDTIQLMDANYIFDKVRVRTLSPITVSINVNGRKQYITLDKDSKNINTWIGAIKENLLKRARAYLGGKELEVQLRIINSGRFTAVEYQGIKIPSRHAVLEIKGNPEILDVAVYGGLGERTGSGFGMVFPV